MGKLKEGGTSGAPKKAESNAGGGNKPAQGRRRSYPLFANLLQTSPYKAGQGKLVRGLTGAALLAMVAFGTHSLWSELASASPAVRLAVPGIVLAGGAWFVYRLIHYPRFAEFLIGTESEMNKVSWITRDHLKVSTTVVLVCVFVLTLYLFVVDLVWYKVLELIGILGA